MLFGIVQLLYAQRELNQKAQLGIQEVRALSAIHVPLELMAADTQLFVPYCGEFNGEKFLCNSAAHLESRTPQGWRPAKLRTTFGVMGALRLDLARWKQIPPRSGSLFIFSFRKRYFIVVREQQLRVVVDAWPDEESMKTGERPIQLTSPPLKCP